MVVPGKWSVPSVCVPSSLDQQLLFATAAPLDPIERIVVQAALDALDKYILTGNKPTVGNPANALFVLSPQITLDFTDTFGSAYGLFNLLIVFPLFKWRRSPHYFFIFLSVIEEVLHTLWGIHDERAVKVKVLEVLHAYGLERSFDDLYDGDPPKGCTASPSLPQDFVARAFPQVPGV